jgi:integrase
LTSKITINDVIIRQLKPVPDKIHQITDAKLHGFGVRIRPSGIKTFFYIYKFQGRVRRMTFGRYPDMKLATARAKAEDARQMVRHGRDPQQTGPGCFDTPTPELLTPFVPKVVSPTFAEAIGDYLTIYCSQHNKPRVVYEKGLVYRKNFLPAWKDKLVNEITAKDVHAILDGMVHRGAPKHANNARIYIGGFFTWAVSRDYIPKSPCLGIRKPSKIAKRQRNLDRDELKLFWAAAEAHGYPIGLLTQIALLTAQRKMEVASMRWRDINLEAKLWTIPAERNKSGRTHLVPLSDLVVSILKRIQTLNTVGEAHDRILWSEYVFPSRHDPKKHLTSMSKAKALLAKNAKLEQHWVIHDLRRTAVTKMGELKVPRYIRSIILNHRPHDATDHYDMYEYLEERREALDRWSAYLESLVAEPLAA